MQVIDQKLDHEFDTTNGKGGAHFSRDKNAITVVVSVARILQDVALSKLRAREILDTLQSSLDFLK